MHSGPSAAFTFLYNIMIYSKEMSAYIINIPGIAYINGKQQKI